MSKKKNNNYSRKKNNSNVSKQNNYPVKNNIDDDEIVANKVEVSKDGKKLIETTEFDDTFKKEINNIKHNKEKSNRHPIVGLFSIILLITALIYFGINIVNKNIPIQTMIVNVFLTLFTILFVTMSFTYNRKNKSIVFMSSLLLLIVFGLSIYNSFNGNGTSTTKLNDFRGKDLAYVTKWASKNNIKLNQVYEYNDLVEEYKVMAQDAKLDSDGNISELTISISEGPNPSKEIIVPSMISWDSERVINYVKDNYLTNVVVEFVESDKAKNTVIEQNTSGNLKRDDELKLTFSYGEELGFEEVTLVDFSNMSKFEVEFYMKQNQLSYKFSDSFSSKVKKGYVVKQSIESGKTIKINDETINITLSKGPKIKVPDMKNMSMTDVTEWAIKNKLKINFSDKYDDSVKENNVISCNFETDEVIEQGTVVKVVLSRGPLKMMKFKSIDDFYSWADKYEIKYEERHEFSDSVDAGDVISYSYKAGEAIKNDDTIIVTISDGKKREVPSLKGLTKKEAINKLEKVGLNYNFVYKNSVEDKDIVLKQSISGGSEVSTGVTITVTLSNGKSESSSKKENNDNNKEVEKREETNNSNNNEEYKEEPKPQPAPEPEPEPEPQCNSCTITGIKGIISSNMGEGYNAVANALVSEIKSQCPGIKVVVNADTTSEKAAGSFIRGFNGGPTDSCSTVTITLAK